MITRSQKRSTPRQSSVAWIVMCFASSGVALYFGLLIGWHTGQASNVSGTRGFEDAVSETSKLRDLLKKATADSERQAMQISELRKREKDLEIQLNAASHTNSDKHSASSESASPHHADIFDESHTGKFASGLQFVDRDDFATTFDSGVPLDETTKGNDRVLILYSDPKAFPTKKNEEGLLSAVDATSNCKNLHVVLTHDRQEQCIAIMGQYESFHIQKFMRVGDQGFGKGKTDANLPLKYASRGHQQNGRISAKIPSRDATREHWENLVSYLQTLDKALEDLEPVLKQVVGDDENNTVIVLVCNFGQSELLFNFICNARAKGFENLLSEILLFATDQATHDLATMMGITSIYIDSVFSEMPEDAAGHYLDKNFRKMMIAKVYCIHMVSMLGYDILFQDVDVVWYQNPLTWFHNTSNPHYDFDMYFQDDGNHGLFYAPYSANTGFYYVRNNERTQHFFNSFLMIGDRVIASGSHQIPLISLLSEYASLYGLRVKTWERNQIEFPGGYNFHQRKHKNFMKDLMSGGTGSAKDTYIFHMSWTNSKSNKIKFLQQMGEWYLEDTCLEGWGWDDWSVDKLKGKNCCAAAPVVTCHYRDKPSKIPCKDSPPIDKGARSWW